MAKWSIIFNEKLYYMFPKYKFTAGSTAASTVSPPAACWAEIINFWGNSVSPPWLTSSMKSASVKMCLLKGYIPVSRNPLHGCISYYENHRYLILREPHRATTHLLSLTCTMKNLNTIDIFLFIYSISIPPGRLYC